MGDESIQANGAVQRTAWRLFVGSLLNEGAIGFFFTLWPLYIASLGAAPSEIGLVIGTAGILRLLFLLPSGWLVDRLPLRLLIAGMRAVAAFGFALCALAREWWQLFPGVVAISLGVVAFPALSTLIAGLASEGEARTRYFTLIYTVAPSIATIVTPAAAGWLAEHWGLRATLVAASAATASAALIFWTIRLPTDLATTRGEGSYRELLTIRPIALSAILMVGTIGGIMLGWVLAPNYLQEVHSLSLEQIGWLGSIAAVGSTVLSLAVSRNRWLQHPFNTLLVATGAVVAGFLLLLIGNHFAIFVLAYLLRGGFLVAWSAFYAVFGLITPEQLRSRVFAVAEILGGLGSTIAPFLAGILYEFDTRLPIVTGLACTAVVVVATRLVQRSTDRAMPLARPLR
ncbi:MFS transporter [Thermomicrobium sp. 4228-Ro]|uniref:MFS transporter n=1 Tax=Thermomicrobium sp. 4228-Ro TaxID=2993937 RepID=UPI002248FF01|nr:MFS transporter [Thermomicrobium sp. 4228-Ro]MCX2726957.1 MFS transporter [Thermomicrobium sp. 4228-Ro]